MSLPGLFLLAAGGNLALPSGDAVTAAVVLVIFFIGGVTFLVGVRELGHYGRELAALRRARRNLDEELVKRQVRESEAAERGEEGGESDEGEGPVAPGPLAIDELRTGLWTGSLVHHRLEAIARMNRRRVTIDGEMLQRLSVSRDAARLGLTLPRYGAGTCLLIGIFGTFLGLAIVVQGIELGLPSETASIDVDSWLSAVRELRTVLGGMRTAFITSLAGIGAAILCSFIDYATRQRRRRLFDRLEHFTQEELLPEIAPESGDESLLARVSRRLEASFERLDDIQRANQEVLKDLTGAQRAFAAIVDEMKRLTGSDARQDLELTRFRGHCILLGEEKGVHDVEESSPISGGVPPADGGAGTRRSHGGGAVAGVRADGAVDPQLGRPGGPG